MTMKQVHEGGLEDPGQQCDRNRSADNRDRKRPLSLRPYAGRERGRKQTQTILERRHHYGAKTAVRAHDNRIDKRVTFVPERADVEVEQDAIHDRDRENRDEAHCGGNTERGACHGES